MKARFGISAMQYMQAHGNSPGPTHRPRLTGAISGLLAFIPSMFIQYLTAALSDLADSVGINEGSMTATIAAVAVIAGIIYAAVFKRAANDPVGGWLLGISYGFLIWTAGPVTAWQLAVGRPLAAGPAAIGLLLSHLAYGLVLGVAYPFVNRLTQSKMR
jgi:uncharacterized membrane protein